MFRLVGTVEEAIPFLEDGECIIISSGCIGHTMHCMEQDRFKRELEEIYKDRLIVNTKEGVCRYSYEFKLK